MSSARHFTISRPAGRYRDGTRRYRVMVDGRQALTIGPGEIHEVPISQHSHIVQARIDWTGSPTMTIAAGDECPSYVVEPAGNALRAVLQIVGRTRYLRLTPTPTEDNHK